MRIFFLLAILIITSCSKNVDLIVHNAIVYSGGEELSQSSAFAVKDGIFIDLSEDDSDILKKYSSRNIINAQGLPIYSGFIDSHSHFYNLGYSINQVDLFDTKSIEEVVSRVIEYDNKRNSNFIIGRGWDQNDWLNKSFPTNKLLNESFPDKPVVLRRIDGHAYLVNNAALELANITNSSKTEGGSETSTTSGLELGYNTTVGPASLGVGYGTASNADSGYTMSDIEVSMSLSF